MLLRTKDRALIPAFCAALPEVAEERPNSEVELIQLWRAAHEWAVSHGYKTFPLGGFRRLILATGYRVAWGRDSQPVYGLALRTTY